MATPGKEIPIISVIARTRPNKLLVYLLFDNIASVIKKQVVNQWLYGTSRSMIALQSYHGKYEYKYRIHFLGCERTLLAVP
jgi:hypothetical protein